MALFAERVSAPAILQLVRQKHSEDVVVPECKDGPTQSRGSHRRLDVWVMARSWSKPTVWGYEIKVSRSDFQRDNKWQDYLPLCNQLFFVCPWGLIEPAEVPGDCGLLWASRTGSKLFVKKKAAHRTIELPENLWRYIVMCRSRITASDLAEDTKGVKQAYWRAWLAEKQIDQRFGYQVGHAIRQRIEKEIDAVRAENRTLVQRMEAYDAIRRTMVAMGLDPDDAVHWSYRTEQRIKDLTGAVPDSLVYAIDNLQRDLERVSEELKKLKERHPDG